MTDVPRVKICGLTNNRDLLVADEAGADLLGIVLSEGFGRSVSDQEAPRVVEGARAATVAVVVDETAARIRELAGLVGASVVQLHGDESPGTIEALRSLGDWSVWKAVRAAHVTDIVRAADLYGGWVHGLLIEGSMEGVVGGSGVRLTVDPVAVRSAIPDEVDFVLAGGLTPTTVGEALARFHPDVVDVSSGVESSVGVKDPELVKAFIESVRGATLPGPTES